MPESEDWPEGRPERRPEPRPRQRERGSGEAAARIRQQQTWVDLQVRAAMERGEFDDLPGAGKPIEDLGTEHDPEWWLKKLVERERLVVLPLSVQLRKEDAELDAELDRLATERAVRARVEDFNERVIRARYALPEGPPLITMPRDVDETVAGWAARREARLAARRSAPEPAPARRWRRRSRAARAGRPAGGTTRPGSLDCRDPALPTAPRTNDRGAMQQRDERPWLVHYGPGVPANIEIPDEPVTAALERAAERWPDRVALDFLGATTTYGQTDRAVRRAMAALHDLGVRRGDRVALVLPNSPTHLVAFHAVLRLGAIAVELNPTYTAEELRHLLADSGATFAVVWHKAVASVLRARAGTALAHVVSADISRDLPRKARVLLRLPVAAAREKRAALRGDVPADIPDWHDLVGRARADVPAADAGGDDVALLQYTGGTTGTPKAAVLSHRNLVANVVHGQAWAGFRPGEETVYGVLPFFHAFGLTFCLTLPGHIGATLVMFPNFDPPAVLDALRRRPATFIGGVAPMFDRIARAAEEAGGAALDGMRRVRLGFAGAMPIPTATVERWERLTGGLLIEGYGMTECAPIALGNPCTPDRRPGTLGVPFPNTDLRIVDVDDHTLVVAPDEDGVRRGELLVRGPQVFAGYWNRPDETAHQLLEGGWLRTGDVVEVDATGWVTLVDRVKEMIIVGGFKVYPSQVEDHLRTMPGVADVAVVGIATDAGDDRVLAALVLEEGAPEPDLDAVRAYAEGRVPRYALPREVRVVDDLPRSQIGKVMRRLVQERFSA